MELSIRQIESKDCGLLFEWANLPEVRANSLNSNPITYDDHLKWFQRKLKFENGYVFLAENESNAPIGTVKFDKKESWFIGITIDPQFRGLGLAAKIINLGCNLFFEISNETIVYAQIKTANISSIKSFLKIGFIVVAHNEDVETLKFEKPNHKQPC